MLDNVARNLRRWDKDHAWPRDGDEWNRQAAACGVDYEVWKRSLVRHLIDPHVDATTHALEIAPGHGRWTEYLAARAGRVSAVDLSPSCIEFCRRRFEGRGNIDYFVTDGTTLPEIAADFVFSFDAFVHMDRDVTGAYLKEIARVLKPGGAAAIHHSNVDDLASHAQDGAAGWRAPMTAELFAALARDASLEVVDQIVYWEDGIGVPRLGDRVARLKKP